MGTITQAFKAYNAKTGSYSLLTADQSSANWDATYAAAYSTLTTAVEAIVRGTVADLMLAPVRTYTPNVAAPTDPDAQLGITWDLYGTDAINGRKYLLASIPVADPAPGGVNLLLPGSDQANPSTTLIGNLYTALDGVALLSPQGNVITASSYQMFLNEKRRTARPT